MHSNESGYLTLQTVISELLRSVPEFRPDEIDVRESNSYLVFGELVDFVFGLNPEVDLAVIQRVFAFLEHASLSPDEEVCMLLRDVAWAIAERWNLKQFKPFVGPKMLKLIRQSPAGVTLKG